MLPPPVPWLRRMRCGALQHHLEVLADTFFARWAPQCAVLCAHFVSGRKFSAPHLAGKRPPRCPPPVPWLRRMRCGALQHHLGVLADTFFARWAPQCAVLCAPFVSGRKFSAPHLAGQRPPRCAPPGALCSADEVQDPSVPPWGARGHIFCSLGTTMRCAAPFIRLRP